MDTKSFEVIIHAQSAFHTLRTQVQEYEDCRQTFSPQPKDPMECLEKSKNLVLAFQKSGLEVEPLCVESFNDARECLFKADGNVYNCKQYMKLFEECNLNPKKFKSFYEGSTEQQKQPKRFDFMIYGGHFDKYR